MQLQPVYRVIVFVPPEALATLKQGIVAADPLVAGGYAEGMWESAPGQEQFRVLEGTQSVAGQAGELVRMASVRLEFCLPRDDARLQKVLDAIAAHHPWNSPAIFVESVAFATP